MIDCFVCKNKDICKYKEATEKYDLKLSVDLPKNLELGLNCKYYERLDFDFNDNPSTILVDEKPASCKDCIWHKTYGDSPAMGDVPCQWCEHNPLKVTC